MATKFTMKTLNDTLARDIWNKSDRDFVREQILTEENYEIDENVDIKKLVYDCLDQVVREFGEAWTPAQCWRVVVAALRHNHTDYDDFLQYLCDQLGFTPSREIVKLIKKVYRSRADIAYPDFFEVVREVWKENQ